MFGLGDIASRELMMFAGFSVVVGFMLYIDLFLVNRKAHIITIKSALIWSAIWIGTALLFNVFVYYELGYEKAMMYLTAYIIEKSLSVDNLFVFIVVFGYFGTSAAFSMIGRSLSLPIRIPTKDFFIKTPSPLTLPLSPESLCRNPFFVIASDQRERGNLFVFRAL